MRRVCVFCGASSGRLPAYADGARRLGSVLAGRRVGLVYGGGRVGLMGAVADAALAAGGDVVGVIPQDLVDRELAHGGLSELRVVDSLHERKALMSDLADGFVAPPAASGRWTSARAADLVAARLHAKPIGLLDVEEYWRPLIGSPASNGGGLREGVGSRLDRRRHRSGSVARPSRAYDPKSARARSGRARRPLPKAGATSNDVEDVRERLRRCGERRRPRPAALARHRRERVTVEPRAVIQSVNGAGSRSTFNA